LRILGSSKYDEKTKEHVSVKKAMHPKDGTIFDFMIRPPNDESEIAKSLLLVIRELEVKGCNNTNGEMTQAEFDFVKTLLRDNCVEGYILLLPSDNIPDLFPLTCNSLSYYPLCDRSIVVKMLILYEKIKHIDFIVTVPIRIRNLEREIPH